ncbi:MAG: hypothetical protein ACE5DK_08010, partial [Paracoccaceae bacterium]
MTAILKWLGGIRASNLIFLFVSPVLIYLIAISRSYGPALQAVLGVEDEPFTLLTVFIVFAAMTSAGFFGGLSILRSLRPDDSDAQIRNNRRNAAIALAVQLGLGLVLTFSQLTDSYLVSVVVNEYDPRSVDWIIVRDKNFILDPVFQAAFLLAAKKALM